MVNAIETGLGGAQNRTGEAQPLIDLSANQVPAMEMTADRFPNDDSSDRSRSDNQFIFKD